jgi:hypothetical protein
MGTIVMAGLQPALLHGRLLLMDLRDSLSRRNPADA